MRQHYSSVKCHLSPFRRRFRLSASWILFHFSFHHSFFTPLCFTHFLSLLCFVYLSLVFFFLSSIFVLPFMSPHIIVVFESPYLTTLFFLFLTLCLSLLHPFCPSLSLLDKTTRRLDELMMCLCLNLPSLHIHHNIYHIFIYFLGEFTYSKISK